MATKEKLPRNVSAFVDRHGKRRYRFRKTGLATRYFEAHPGSAEGQIELATFLAGRTAPALVRHAPGTVGDLAARWFASPSFTAGKAPQTLRTARLILDKFVAEFAAARVADWRFEHIEAVLTRAAKPRIEKGRRRGGPTAALNLRGELKPMFDFAIKLRLIQTNPVDLAVTPRAPRGGFHTWTEGEIAQYRAHHQLGTAARLALEIFLWTAQRRGDASTFGRRHLVNGMIEVTPAKTRESTGATIALPAAPQLTEAIAAMQVTGTETFLVNRYGRPFSRAGLGNKMREWCDEAGLPHCSAHGLRKAATRRAAEHGATNQQLKAMGGWTTDKQVGTYTAAAEQKRMARAAMDPVIEADLANQRKTDLANPPANPQKT